MGGRVVRLTLEVDEAIDCEAELGEGEGEYDTEEDAERNIVSTCMRKTNTFVLTGCPKSWNLSCCVMLPFEDSRCAGTSAWSFQG